jgi:hypothetical protein
MSLPVARPLPHAQARLCGGRSLGGTNRSLHTSMPTARINARPLLWRTTPGFIR